SFMMSPDGQALMLDADGRLRPRELPPEAPANFSDLFYSKGLAAAGAMLGRDDAVREAKRLFARVVADIRDDRFASDQEMLDPRNPVRPTLDRVPQGPMMIAVGGAAV